jgi:hypothetical protein
MWFLRAVVAALALLGIAVAMAPEPAALPMPQAQVRVIEGEPTSIALAAIGDRDAAIRRSIRGEAEAKLWRAWTPDGVRPLAMEIGPLKQVDYLGVAYQGSVRERETRNALYLRCTVHDQIKPIASGATNTTITETVIPLGRQWCQGGEVYLRLVSLSTWRNLGVARPYEVSALAYLKHSYLGQVGYLLAAFGVVVAGFFAGGLAARAVGRGMDSVLGGLLGVGSLSLLAFYAYAWAPLPAPAGLIVPITLLAAVGASWRLRPEVAKSVWRTQRGPVLAWFWVGLGTFTILHLGSAGAGAWEPAFRFAPATWSSDHLLPAMLAEAARIGVLPADGLLGGWSLSDRPPLMAGGYLLFADVFAAMQFGNDGRYLQPALLGVGGVVLCSLWAASLYWAARRIGRLNPSVAALGVALVAATPFALFNTGYTWPKMLAAAFSLAAAAYVLAPHRGGARPGEAMVFGALAAFAMLCHAASAFFLAPVSLIYFACRLWRAPKAATAGAALGLVMLASWSAFKATVLPSQDPLLGYALTGELTLDPAAPPLMQRLAARYETLDLARWLATKAEIGAYLATPHPTPGPESLARPPAGGETDLVGALRYWDFHALTAGNLALLLLAAAGAWGAWALRRRDARRAALAGRLMLAAFGCYGLFVGGTFLPLIVHQFSYDAVMAMGLAGLVVLGALPRGRSILALLLAATGLYSALVWVVAPLFEVVRVDLAAAVVLGLMLVFGLPAIGRPSPPPERRRTALAAIGLAAIAGGLVAVRPQAVAFETHSPALAYMTRANVEYAVDPTRCEGRLDGVVQRRAGGWRVYGWAWDLTTGAPPRAARLFDAERLVGTTPVDGARPDVAAAVAFVTSAKVGWSLDVPARPRSPFVVVRLADGTMCRLGGP